MHSFTDVTGTVVPFEDRNELTLDLQRDVVTGNVTAYLVHYNDHIFTVDQVTYSALESM